MSVRLFTKGEVLAYGEACVGAGKAAGSLQAGHPNVEIDRNIEIAARLLKIIDEIAP